MYLCIQFPSVRNTQGMEINNKKAQTLDVSERVAYEAIAKVGKVSLQTGRMRFLIIQLSIMTFILYVVDVTIDTYGSSLCNNNKIVIDGLYKNKNSCQSLSHSSIYLFRLVRGLKLSVLAGPFSKADLFIFNNFYMPGGHEMMKYTAFKH